LKLYVLKLFWRSVF